MKISAVDNTNFGMAVKVTPEAKEFLAKRLTDRGVKKLEKLVKSAENDSVDVNLSTVVKHTGWGTCPDMEKVPYDQLVVNVGNGYRQYEPEGMSFFIINAIKKAVKEAHALSKNKKTLDEIL